MRPLYSTISFSPVSLFCLLSVFLPPLSSSWRITCRGIDKLSDHEDSQTLSFSLSLRISCCVNWQSACRWQCLWVCAVELNPTFDWQNIHLSLMVPGHSLSVFWPGKLPSQTRQLQTTGERFQVKCSERQRERCWHRGERKWIRKRVKGWKEWIQ